MLVFNEKYVKGYAFNHDKVKKVFDIEPNGHVAFSLMCMIVSKHRDSYIAVAEGHLPKDNSETRRAIFVLDSGNDYDELKKKELTDVAPWFKAAQKNTLTRPDVYIYLDYIYGR
ncbi:hypothetical protein CVT25_000106 [Psilocybe cyanescens]|uniref:Uncharacterized protein n=1 Tax=Psilocybe cyanescens TaxID=93625 RepID=A0A409XQ58_PSICY|nr:hypothetical protein CVT25_000106 [Psilocybe cyanescens]